VREDRLARGVALLRELGYEPVLAANVSRQAGLFAGDDAERLAGFHALAADPDIRAILFARGGHGMLRVLPGIDWELLRREPRFYIGYSDLTPFLTAWSRGSGSSRCTDRWWPPTWRAIPARRRSRRSPRRSRPASACAAARRFRARRHGGGRPARRLPLAAHRDARHPARAGRGGAILAWEDTNEPLYRVDRMLTHLGLSGTLSAVHGMVMGSCPLAGEDAGAGRRPHCWRACASMPRQSPDRSPSDCRWGHQAPNWTLPLGHRVGLDSSLRELVLR
jgi:muramoyltetrapeptide carboxypeptidase